MGRFNEIPEAGALGNKKEKIEYTTCRLDVRIHKAINAYMMLNNLKGKDKILTDILHKEMIKLLKNQDHNVLEKLGVDTDFFKL